jgi:2-oxoglutarate dehydrogenase E1 component
MPDETNSLPEAAAAALANPALVDRLYETWKVDPASLSADWQMFFQGFELATCPRACAAADRAHAQSRVDSLMFAYRSLGHLAARLDPLGNNPETHPDLELSAFGLATEDLAKVFDTGHLGGPERATLEEIVGILKETYCGTVGVEYTHIQDRAVRRWIQGEIEPERNRPKYDREGKLDILERLVDADLFESFIHSRYPGQKRFSLEGCESLIAALHAVVEMAPEMGVEEIVLGMAHRGRLNVLANILDKSYATLFSEFEENLPPLSVGGDGDVKYHRGYTSDHTDASGRIVHLSLAANPSHLEAVDPVVLGKARAKQRRRGDMELRTKVLPILVHGDAAFAGQGLVAETLNLSQLEGYRVGGTVHFIANNQIGFTTLPRESRSSLYSTDVAKMIEAPIFHVNGDDPEAVAHASDLALRFRQKFHRDVVVDIIGYRRYGHNEGDEPAFTQPALYKKIRNHPPVRAIYTRRLVEEGTLSGEEAEAQTDRFQARLQAAYDEVKTSCPLPKDTPEEGWEGLSLRYSPAPVQTAVSREVLLEVGRAITTVPEAFRLNPKVARRLPEIYQALETGGNVDWSTAELLAFGALLAEGTPVRLSGQDSARGTFSQRHSVWQEMETQEPYVPLNHIREGQSKFCVYNSSLSEAAVLGFDYGYSLAEPRMLVLWEAQFGDFANGAQVILDQFVVSSVSKWRRASGLVMLLPHGQEGQGPEHSNAFPERYLAACAEENIQVCNLTTPAQYFHALRRQVKRDFRRPLVIFSPKSLLRHPRCGSPTGDLVEGRFHEVLDDPAAPAQPERLVLCSGKIFYDLIETRDREGASATIVRVEQIYPFPEPLFREITARYPGVQEVVWTQEEAQNRGYWTFMFPRLLQFLPGKRLLYAGRPPAASPAVGSLKQFKADQERVVRAALGLKIKPL